MRSIPSYGEDKMSDGPFSLIKLMQNQPLNVSSEIFQIALKQANASIEFERLWLQRRLLLWILAYSAGVLVVSYVYFRHIGTQLLVALSIQSIIATMVFFENKRSSKDITKLSISLTKKSVDYYGIIFTSIPHDRLGTYFIVDQEKFDNSFGSPLSSKVRAP